MRQHKGLAALLLGLFLVAGARQADADAWCKTRSHCWWLSKRYTANARTGCIPFIVPLCWHHSGGCGSAAASCSNACIVGNASASASNSSSGCFLSTSRTGLGVAGTSSPDLLAASNDRGNSRLTSSSDFDDARGTVTINLDSGELQALAGGNPERIEAYVFVDDAPEGQAVEEAIRTSRNTLWSGSVDLRNGVLTVNGFNKDAFRVSTDATGLTTVSISGARAVVPVSTDPVLFERLVVEVTSTETGASTEGVPAGGSEPAPAPADTTK